MIFNKENNQLIGACLITIWESIPLIYDIAVDKNFQGKGIGKNLLKHVLTELNSEYNYLVLFVTLGNSSESLYYNLGFRRGGISSLFLYDNK
jgi:ribosomal protein S18 acetylase RimI-like enzyme